MSQDTRIWVANRLIYQDSTQKSDLLDENITKTGLIAFLQYMIQLGHILEITAVKTDHHNDSDLGEHCHFNGWCVDCWFLNSFRADDYMDANNPKFQQGLKDAANSPDHYQTGLAGSAITQANIDAAGDTYFQDYGGDHIHFGAK